MDPWTAAIHADDGIEAGADDVSPAVHPSTTFRYDRHTNAPGSAIYSRELFPTVSRLEKVFEKSIFATGDDTEVHAVTYCSGLSAVNALLLWHAPKRIFISRAETGGYHGTLAVSQILSRFSGMAILHLDDLTSGDETLRQGDLVWLESPINPHGICLDVPAFARLAKEARVPCVVDSTFAPPPLYDALSIDGVTSVMHSATKYFGGHSDLLAGVVATRDAAVAHGLREDRISLGTIPSSQTSWLLLRSLRTFHMRVARQSATATEIVKRLVDYAATSTGKRVLHKVSHSSVQLSELRAAGEDTAWLECQVVGGHTPTFAILLQNEEMASKLPSFLQLYQHATSLGGVESLVEWRVLSDEHCDRRLVRLSTGCENVDDLWADLKRGLDQLASG